MEALDPDMFGAAVTAANRGPTRNWGRRGGLHSLIFGALLTLTLSGCFEPPSDPFDPFASERGGGTAAAPPPASNVTGELQGTDPGPEPANMPAARSTTASDAIRFQEQSTFGPTEAGTSEVMQKGPALALEEQFYKPSSVYQSMNTVNNANVCVQGSGATCNRDNYTAYLSQVRFYRNAVHNPDQLRQRAAFALGQIFVVSNNDINRSYAIALYQQSLMNHSFGNLRDLLVDITLSPIMGQYLDIVNNQKPDLARGIEPNENYARELLQLFSIGEVMLNADGTRQLDPQGNPVPSYDQDAIESFARIFTGWTYPTRPGQTQRWPNPENLNGRMVVNAAQHDTGAKTLLLGQVVPAGQTPEKDIQDAIQNVFNHPNFGPYIGKQLIQFLVTSNPTAAYMGRVTAAFSDNGQGVRGDMKAILRAILLDPEARGDAKPDNNYGKLREPALLVTGVVRGLGGSTDGIYLRTQSELAGQAVFDSPTVFNFYPPDYLAPGTTDLLGPQFKILHTDTVLRRANFVNDLIFTRGGNVPAVTDFPGATGTQVTLATLQGMAATPDAMIDRLNTTMMPSTLSASDRQAIATAVNAVPATDAARRSRTAVYLVATSPQYNVTR